MAFIPAESTAEFVFSFTGPNGNIMKNVMNIRETTLGGWDTTLLSAMLTTLANWHSATADTWQSNQITLTSILGRDLSVADSWVVENGYTQVGAVAQPVLPANVTFCVKGVTGLAGRTHRARLYWIGLAETMVSGDFLTTGAADGIVAAMNTLRTTLTGFGYFPVVVSRQLNGVPRVTAEVTNITGWTKTDNRVDTQRRRLIGEGS